jgi:hypothetical protein
MAQYPCRCGETCAKSADGNCHGQVCAVDEAVCPRHLCATHRELEARAKRTKPRRAITKKVKNV